MRSIHTTMLTLAAGLVLTVGTAVMAADGAETSSEAPFSDLLPVAEDCLMCGSSSTDKCDGAGQCKGTRKHCKSIGCKITGTSSWSTSANVKVCKSCNGETRHPPEGHSTRHPPEGHSGMTFGRVFSPSRAV
ncbi:MAG: hypothetical protein ACI9MR_004147 [Myxococcota bacterium]|jgi:hypothetical protein